MGNALVVVPEQDLATDNLYVDVNDQARPVAELHPEDKNYACLDPTIVLRQHPDAYFRLRAKPDATWRSPPGAASPRQGLDGFLAPRFPGLAGPAAARVDGQRLSTWGWVAVIGSALNAVGLLFYPLGDSSTVATLRAYGGQPTPLIQLLSRWWFSPLLAVLTVACLAQAFRSPVRRKLWISVSYLPVLMGFVAAMLGALSAFSSLLNGVK